jgi:hypothetical protein
MNNDYAGCFGGNSEDNEKKARADAEKAEQEAKALKAAEDKAKKPGANKAVPGPEETK